MHCCRYWHCEYMDPLRFEIFQEINNLLNNQESKGIYCDLDIRINGSVVQSTNKLVVFLLHPFLESSLSDLCLILSVTEPWDDVCVCYSNSKSEKLTMLRSTITLTSSTLSYDSAALDFVWGDCPCTVDFNFVNIVNFFIRIWVIFLIFVILLL